MTRNCLLVMLHPDLPENIKNTVAARLSGDMPQALCAALNRNAGSAPRPQQHPSPQP